MPKTIAITAKEFQALRSSKAFQSHLYVVGIDPGTHTGFALWCSTSGKLISVETYTAHEAWAAVRNLIVRYGSNNIYVRFEDARKRKWFGKSGREKLQGAGSIKRDCVLWEEFCEREKLAYDAVAPKDSATKERARLKVAPYWKGRTSVHARDAAALIVPDYFNPISY